MQQSNKFPMCGMQTNVKLIQKLRTVDWTQIVDFQWERIRGDCILSAYIYFQSPCLFIRTHNHRSAIWERVVYISIILHTLGTYDE